MKKRLGLVLAVSLHFTLYTLHCLYADELMVQEYLKGLKDKKQSVRISSAKSLGEIGKSDFVAPLRDVLNDKSVNVRLAVVEALSKIQDDSAVSALAVAIRDIKKEVRLKAVDGLAQKGEAGNKTAIGPLIEATKDKKPDVKISAVNVLGVISKSEVGGGGAGASVIQSISHLLTDKNIMVRLATIYAIGNIGGLDAIRALSPAVCDKKDEVAIAAINVLGAIGDKNAIPLLTPVLSQKRHITVYEAVADALVTIGDNTAIPSLVEILEKLDEEQKSKFKEAIIKILEKNRTKKGIVHPPSPPPVTPTPTPSSPPAETVQPAATPQQPSAEPSATPESSQQEKLNRMSSHYTAGVNLYRKREYEKAIAEWEEVLKLDPNHKKSKDMIQKAKKQLSK
ncbi:MAG: HEAT repeat domain-containing protein [Elusimicrobiota bacterium]